MMLIKFIRKSKVNQLGFRKQVFFNKHDILWFDVPVHDALVVNVCHRGENLENFKVEP